MMMYFRSCHVTAAAILWMVASVAMAADFTFLQQAYFQVEESEVTTEDFFENDTSRLMDQIVHENGPGPQYLADRSNFVLDFANFFNAKSFADMQFDNFRQLTTELIVKTEQVCPDFMVDCSSSSLSLKYRPINGVCNNKQHPHWGSANIAQTRLVPAVWEKTALIRVDLDNVSPQVALDRLGVRVAPNGLGVNPDTPLVMHMSESSIVEISFLQGTPVETTLDCRDNNECQVDGPILAISQEDTEECVQGTDYWLDGNQVVSKGPCKGPFIVNYQPFAARVVLDNANMEESYVELAGGSRRDAQVLSTPPQASEVFWFRVSEQRLRVGWGSQCIKSTQIIDIDFVLNLDPPPRYTLAARGLDDKVNVAFPIRDFLRLETDRNDRSAGNLRTLSDAPWVFNDGSLLFGVEGSSESQEVILKDTGNNINVTVHFGPGGFIRSDIKQPDQPVLTVTQPFTNFEPSNIRFHEQFDSRFKGYWISWLGNRIYTGRGNIVGKSAFQPILALATTAQFTVADVQLHTETATGWVFDLVQRNTPRQRSLSGRKLPTARDVSLAVHKNVNPDISWSKVLTMAAFQWGQFLDHDMVATPTETGTGHCCDEHNQFLEDAHRFCFPIEISDKARDGNYGSFRYPDHRCMNLVRSAAMLSCEPQGRDLRNREMLNVITSFIDASNVYGSMPESAKELRAGADHTSAYLRTDGRELPHPIREVEAGGEGACLPSEEGQECREAGDGRAMEQPLLAAMHTLFMREHNRLVDQLINTPLFKDVKEENKTTYNELIYQEARRILIAEVQVITYKEYLPSFMDAKILAQYNVALDKPCPYDSSVNPSIPNEVGIAYRFGHTWIPDFIDLASLKLQDMFFNPSVSYRPDGSDSIMGTLAKACPDTDAVLESSVREHLFNGFDLAALNIQRGRDHGVGTYCDLRRRYNLTVPETFDDLLTMNIATQQMVDQLKNGYDCVCDIDLFTGVLLERPMISIPGSNSRSTIGVLLNHILAEFFRSVKCGDRYWFENPDAGFNPGQIQQLKEATLSHVLCKNTILEEFQGNVFNVENKRTNPKKKCQSLSHLDINLFVKGRKVADDGINAGRKKIENDLKILEDLLDELREVEDEK